MTHTEIIARALVGPCWNIKLQRAKKVISVLAEAGLVIRPVEPTFDMVSEGGSVIWEHASEEKHQMIIRVWKAMIGAEK